MKDDFRIKVDDLGEVLINLFFRFPSGSLYDNTTSSFIITLWFPLAEIKLYGYVMFLLRTLLWYVKPDWLLVCAVFVRFL